MPDVKVVLSFWASQSLALEGLLNEATRLIQTGRKQAGLSIEERTEVKLYSTDEYIRACARLNIEHIKQECLLSKLEVLDGKNCAAVADIEAPYNPAKWHTPCAFALNKSTGMADITFNGGEVSYSHYWAALEGKYGNNSKENS